jgi:hypothetical protein
VRGEKVLYERFEDKGERTNDKIQLLPMNLKKLVTYKNKCAHAIDTKWVYM